MSAKGWLYDRIVTLASDDEIIELERLAHQLSDLLDEGQVQALRDDLRAAEDAAARERTDCQGCGESWDCEDSDADDPDTYCSKTCEDDDTGDDDEPQWCSTCGAELTDSGDCSNSHDDEGDGPDAYDAFTGERRQS